MPSSPWAWLGLEAEDWIQNRDRLRVFDAHVTEAGLAPADNLREIDGAAAAEIDAAEAAPHPEVRRCWPTRGGSPARCGASRPASLASRRRRWLARRRARPPGPGPRRGAGRHRSPDPRGSADLLTPDAETVSAEIPGAKLVSVPGAGHALAIEAAEAVNAALNQHLTAG